jgi:hypothetical protein
MNPLLKIFFAFVLAFPLGIHAQETKKDKHAAMENLVESGNFVFKAQSVFPGIGSMRQLTSEYDLTLAKDTIISHLPYFGRAYNARVYPNEGGIRFTSSDFKVEKKALKKGGWEFVIQPKDAGDVRRMHLSISSGGNASLQVLSNNRQPITFNGYIQEKRS